MPVYVAMMRDQTTRFIDPTKQETTMRASLIIVPALFIAGCVTAPANTTAVYGHKYNTYSYVPK